MLVKRILALEGDVVKTLPPYPDQEIVVPEGYIWVEGMIYPKIYSLQEGLS
jgi:mitochondrial inner membrane protease subunit 2